MAIWLNHVTIAAPRNGTTSHTVDPSSGTVVAGATFTPTAGRMLVVVVEGAVTSTTPAGWTLPSGGSAINITGLYVFYLLSAAGSDTISTTHNASDYPVVYDFYEFVEGSSFVSAAAATGVDLQGGAGPSLSSLTGMNHLAAVCGINFTASSGTGTMSWSRGLEAVDTYVVGGSADGYIYGSAYEAASYASSFSSASTELENESPIGPTAERLVFAVDNSAPDEGEPVSWRPAVYTP